MIARAVLVVFTRTVPFPLQDPSLNTSTQMPGHGCVMLMSTEDLDHQKSSSGDRSHGDHISDLLG